MNIIDAAYKKIAGDEKLKREVPRFLVAGGLAVLTDLAVYYLLILALPYYLSKGISFITGAVVAFVINKLWTFNKKEKSFAEIVKFVLLYLATLGANVLVNQLVLFIFPTFVFLGFLCATGTSTVLNFIGQKWWVFKQE